MSIIYDHRCTTCKHEQEEWRVRSKRKDPGTCRACGGITEHVILRAHRAKLDFTQFPGEDLRNHRDALKEYDRFNRLHDAAEREMKWKDSDHD